MSENEKWINLSQKQEQIISELKQQLSEKTIDNEIKVLREQLATCQKELDYQEKDIVKLCCRIQEDADVLGVKTNYIEKLQKELAEAKNPKYTHVASDGLDHVIAELMADKLKLENQLAEANKEIVRLKELIPFI